MLRLFSSLVSCPGCRQRPAGPAGICAGCLPLLFSLVDRPGLLALGRFEGPLKGVVTALKFRSASRLADPLGAELASQIRRRGWRPLVVTPVPLHPRRAAERGYNQAGLLDRKSTRLNSSYVAISYAVFCLKKKKKTTYKEEKRKREESL